MDLDKQIEIILHDFRNGTEEALEEMANEVADEGVQQLKSISPKDRPEYYAGWGKKKVNKAIIVHNKTYPGLTHLLEKGHVNRDGSRTAAQVHIKPVEEKIIKDYENKIRKRIESL